MTWLFDTMFVRTAVLVAASGLAFAILFLAIGRGVAGLPAIRASAVTLAELLKHDAAVSAHMQTSGPPPASWRDQALASTFLWRTFAGTLEERLGPGAHLEVRGDEAGAIVWVQMPASGNWIHWQTALPAPGLRAGMLALLTAIVAAILVGATLLARQITGPLRELAGITDRFAAGELLSDAPLRGPVEVRRVHEAFQRLRDSLNVAEQEREAVLAGVSHDMRTPISRLRFALELYGEGAGPRLLDELTRDLEELEQVAGRFVSYARSNYEEPASPTVPDALVRSVLAARGLTGAVLFDAGAPVPAAIQAGNVRALVENLLDNACRHGRAPIRVRTGQTDADLTIIVGDGGSGIPAESHAAALQPFTRLAEREAQGSGLGLAIVARVARRHHGYVEMRNLSDGFEVRVLLSATVRLTGHL